QRRSARPAQVNQLRRSAIVQNELRLCDTGSSMAQTSQKAAPEVQLFWKRRHAYEWRLCTNGSRVIAKGCASSLDPARAEEERQVDLFLEKGQGALVGRVQPHPR